MTTTNRLEATKKLNTLKLRCVRNGGYLKHKELLLKACNDYKNKFGIDHTPAQLK